MADVEIDPEAIAVCKNNLHAPVYRPEEVAGLPGNQFDVVTLWDAIEHFHDPARHLRDACRLLRPGGVLYLRTPNARLFDLTRRYRDSSRSNLYPNEHLYHFTPGPLRRLLEQSGFASVRFWAHGTKGNHLLAGEPFLRLKAPRWGKKLLFHLSHGRINIYPNLVATSRKT